MCGIAGYFSMGCTPDASTAVAIALLAHAMQSRGDHSWGCTDGETVSRTVGPISETFTTLKTIPADFALHTRYATTGKVKETNSHPFAVRGKAGLVIGMHNGIISNHEALNRRYQRKCRVDSEHIFEHIAAGIPLDDLDGYGTIVYRAGTDWYMGTFNGGELALSYTRAGLFIASTRKALDTALVAAGLYGGSTVVKTADDTIYKLTPSGLVRAYQVSIGATDLRWDYAPEPKRSKRSAQRKDSRPWADVFSGDTCADCGDLLPLDAVSTVCEHCAASVAGWDIEIVPDGMHVVCDDCGSRVESMQQIGMSGDDYICMDCMLLYDETEVSK